MIWPLKNLLNISDDTNEAFCKKEEQFSFKSLASYWLVSDQVLLKESRQKDLNHNEKYKKKTIWWPNHKVSLLLCDLVLNLLWKPWHKPHEHLYQPVRYNKQGVIIQDFQQYLAGTPIVIAAYLGWYKLGNRLPFEMNFS